MVATHEKSRDLVASLNNFKQIPHSIDVNNSKVSHNRQYRHQQGDQKYFQYDRKDRNQVRKREGGHGRHGTHSLSRHKESSFSDTKLDTLTFDGCLDFEVLTQWNTLK